MRREILFTFMLMASCAINFSSAQENKYLRDSIPDEWSYNSTFKMTPPIVDDWWSKFNDSTLDSLIELATRNNYDLATAMERILIARSATKVIESGYYPSLSVSAGWNYAEYPYSVSDKDLSGFASTNYLSTTLDMSWQVDLFGEVRKQVKESKYKQSATRSLYNEVMLTLCANVATAYISLRTLQTQYFVATEHLSSQESVMDLTEVRFKSGLASMLDVAQARTIYYSTLSSLPTLLSAIDQNINSLAIMIGVYPSEIEKSLVNYKPLPDYHAIVAVGVPLDLLRRRPDIKAAEYTLAAAAAAVGVAKNEFLPTLTISGSIGFDANDFDDLFKRSSLAYSVAPTLSWTIFDGLSRKHTIKSAKQQMEISINDYNNSVMTAYMEVDNAMIGYRYSLHSIEALKTVMVESNRALELSVELYKKGLSSFTNVADAQINSLEYSNSMITSQSKALLSLITLYQALGGGWDE